MPVSHANYHEGCQQAFGINVWEAYAPVAKAESVKVILLLALFLGMLCRKIDFVTAFMNGPLDDVDITWSSRVL